MKAFSRSLFRIGLSDSFPSSYKATAAVAWWTVVAFIAPLSFTHGQPTVDVQDGQTLTLTDLLAGEFQGQAFSLAPETTFEVRKGGVIGPVGAPSQSSHSPFDFGGSTIHINEAGTFEGGRLQFDFDSRVSNVFVDLLNGGSITSGLAAYSGAMVRILGGEAQSVSAHEDGEAIVWGGRTQVLTAYAEGQVTLGGGLVSKLVSQPGGIVRVSGGTVLDFRAVEGSIADISGGMFSSMFEAREGSLVRLAGGEFRLNGAPFTGESVSVVSEGDTLTGVLLDGSPFIFSNNLKTELHDVTLLTLPVPEADTTPIFVDAQNAQAVPGLRSGQTMVVRSSGVISPYFRAVGASLLVEEGVVDTGLQVAESTLNLSGGVVKDFARAHLNSAVTITGGRLGDYFEATSNSVVNVLGGEVGIGFVAKGGSTVNLVGGSIGDFLEISEGTLNVTGGKIGDLFSVGPKSTVNVNGGILPGFYAGYQSLINLSGGTIGQGFTASSTSRVLVNGGTFGANFVARSGSYVTLVGGEFRLNGQEYTGSRITLTSDQDVLSGTLADGSVFVFTPGARDELHDVELVTTQLPQLETAPILVDSVNTAAPRGLRPGQSLTLRGDGRLGVNFAVAEAELLVEGGVIGEGMKVANAEVFVSGGSIGERFHADPGSLVFISGGQIGQKFSVNPGSTVEVSGGSFDRNLRIDDEGSFKLIGGDFRLNGQPYVGSQVTPTSTDVLSGTFADGATFVFSRSRNVMPEITLESVPLPAVDTTPIVVASPFAVAPAGLRPGQTLSLYDFGELPALFEMDGASLNVFGGSVGEGLEAVNSAVTITGGEIGARFDAYTGSEVYLTGGQIAAELSAYEGSTLHISGGTLDPWIRALPGSVVNLYVSEFSLAGMPQDIAPGVPFEISNRSLLRLEAVLANGQAIDLTLTARGGSLTYVSQDATLTVTVVDLPGDFNDDGVVDSIDYAVWRDNLGSTGLTPFTSGDGDGDGAVSQSDFDVWQSQYGVTRDSLSSTGAEAPSPSSFVLALVAYGFLSWGCAGRYVVKPNFTLTPP